MSLNFAVPFLKVGTTCSIMRLVFHDPLNDKIKQVLEVISPHLHYTIDLGCGDGERGFLIRPYTKYLVGVDHNKPRLLYAQHRGIYDELHLCDIRDFNIPSESDSIFMVEVIEHLPVEDGVKLAKEITGKSFVLVTTPERFFKHSLQNGHVSYWLKEEFQNLGFQVLTTSRDPITNFLYGNAIIAFTYTTYTKPLIM